MKNINNRFILRYTQQDDYDFIGEMIDYSNKNIDKELGYPRCDNLGELLAEIELYENTLENSLFIISYDDKPIALGGYLYTEGDDEGYFIGPIIKEEYYNKENIKAIINLILDVKKDVLNEFKVNLEAVLSKNNKLLNECYLELEWDYKRTVREMRYDIDGVKKETLQWRITEFYKNDYIIMNDIFKLLDKTFNWNGNHEKINELLKEDYRVGCVFDKENNVLGVVCWAYLKEVDFSRLEYLVVKEQYRKNRIGEAMINHVINDSIDNKVTCIYLNTGINNNAANLYKKTGFYDTVVSNIYGKSSF
ncbi:GNAT family N-acetyltransferase [Clostridium tagluense]|uniref:GNAT family N-acetyltransferase n=1 Tax=Clostridium tagluense TaxID=360422 RepID=UPI001C0E73FA|nr:GNAT family N-acetyltransferase [Clostridium tagluense]MBU3130745.1 GNAT family N-acetyltransferase [Clostridium tagluense]MCB2313684.1 GNAT family N-acetyltransferase [Clostridium tagluense]MCB2318760.1 GNAT family N-acetyltransferase [Clostridium tagluense]MCB2323610.1 GNAT family N-acetyltransferase [Clostridium tagluense]MCB2328539.1 GNAT family N-acetyltransferase [Clostridium tagluense]